MTDIINYVIQEIDLAYDYIANAISWVATIVGFWGSVATGVNIFPLLEIMPACIIIMAIKFVLKRGK